MAGDYMGSCASCKQSYRIDEMIKHVSACEQRPTGELEGLQIGVRAPELPEFWMLIETQPKASLDDLDAFLRESWLECCSHMSAFKIGNKTYTDNDPGSVKGHGAGVPLSEVLAPGTEFDYEYDFGSTTALALKVFGPLTCKPSTKPVRLLALNEPPQRVCAGCGQPANGLCTECEGTPLCRACTKTHECGDEMIAPIVNSPRAGVCGYTGPAISIESESPKKMAPARSSTSRRAKKEPKPRKTWMSDPKAKPPRQQCVIRERRDQRPGNPRERRSPCGRLQERRRKGRRCSTFQQSAF